MIVEPRFMREGYATYASAPIIMGVETRFGEPTGVKPDAPQWAHDEYDEYVKMQELAKRNNQKL